MGISLLAAADVWRTVGSVLLAVLILLAMITVHELGHYLAGKILHFRIDEFSVGFGPALFKRKGKKTGELFAVRLIPLGGYCAFHGEDGEADGPPVPEEKAATSEQSAESTPAPAPVSEVTPAPAPVSEVTPEKKPPKKRGELWTDDGSFTHMKPWKRILVLVSGALMNYLLALLFLIICFFACGQSLPAVYEAEQGGIAGYSLQDKDILLKADGHDLYLATDLARALNGKKEGDIVRFTLTRLNGEGVRELTEADVMLRADVNVKNSADTESVWTALGVATPATGSYRFGFFETLGRAFVYSFKIAGSILRIIGELFTGNLGLDAFGGPVTTIAMTSQVAGRSLRGFLEIVGFIGVNLAVFNLLPVPALDGCKIVFTLIEWARGKPVSRKLEAVVNAAGFVFLIVFAILVDILQFI